MMQSRSCSIIDVNFVIFREHLKALWFLQVNTILMCCEKCERILIEISYEAGKRILALSSHSNSQEFSHIFYFLQYLIYYTIKHIKLKLFRKAMSLLSNHVINIKWHTFVKIKVYIYYYDFHLSKHRIAEDLDMNHHVVQDILSKSVHCQINFRERNKIIDSDEMQKMIWKICENYTTWIFTWESLKVVCNVHVHAQTIRKAMNETEFHKCKICHHSFINVVEVIKRVF